MHIKIKFFSKDEMLFGVRIGISKLIRDLSSYSPEKEYPRAYNVEIGLVFISLELMIKGSH
jgi:hypothetical protein